MCILAPIDPTFAERLLRTAPDLDKPMPDISDYDNIEGMKITTLQPDQHRHPTPAPVSEVATLHSYAWARLPTDAPTGTAKAFITLPITYTDPDDQRTRAGRIALCAYESYERYPADIEYSKPVAAGTRFRPLRWDELPEAELPAGPVSEQFP